MEEYNFIGSRLMPVLPIRGISVFPGTMLTFDVERPASKAALTAAMEGDQIIFLTAQKDPVIAQPKDEDVYHMGTISRIKQILKNPNGKTVRVLVDGESGSYYPLLQQGAGLANVGNAIASNTYLWMDPSANAGATDGKIKVELGDDPNRTGAYSFSFELNNFGTEAQIYSIYGDFFTQNVVTIDGIVYADKSTTGLNMGVGYGIEGGYVSTSEQYTCDLNNDGITDEKDAMIILDYVSGKTVLVTGGGGSIGSELCRQIARANPKQLIIFDIYENNAYEIQQELKRNHPDLILSTLIGSVRDIKRMNYIIRTFCIFKSKSKFFLLQSNETNAVFKTRVIFIIFRLRNLPFCLDIKFIRSKDNSSSEFF